ncbi:MAG: glycosyltransferase [Gammaproteobacteria bacterium]|nr:glycosyltransferase [Gammaproteobacteria bacterium]
MREADNNNLQKDIRPTGAMPLDVPEISVIVPVYNKAAHLAESLESILAQSQCSLEVICVDDVSTDGSGEILEQFAKKDARVTVICQDRNRGAAVARNAGLAAARGEFVQFTDADDLLTTDALGLLLGKARADKVDVVRGGVVGFRTEANEQQQALDTPQARSRFSPLDHRTFWVPWWHQTYLFSRQFLLSEQIHYPELCSGEDPVFLAQVLIRVPCMSTISTVTYRYRLAPLEQKGRVTYRHLRDYLCHAGQVRSLFLGVHPKAWHSGFAPLLLPEIESMVNNWPITHSERQLAEAEMQQIFDLPGADGGGQAHRKLLFMYNVCGLGGVETSIINKMEALRSQGVEVRALFQSLWGEGGQFAAQQPGFVVLADEEAQQRFIREWNPDAIIVVDAPWLIDVAGQADVCCPILFESHLSERAAMEWRVRGGISDLRVSAILVPSEFNRTLLVEFGADPQLVRVIPNPLDPTRFQVDPDTDILTCLGLPVDRRLVLFVGRLEPAKNPMEFVHVCAELAKHNPGIQCVVLGDAVDTAEYADSVQAEAESTGLSITFRERVAYDDMPLLYNAVAASGGCLLSTSLNESQPMIVLEAMACGCPVVASDVGGLREIIEDGQTGSVYPAGDLQEAAASVSRMLNDKDHRDAIVKAAVDYVNTRHGLAGAATGYVTVLDELGAASGCLGASPQAVTQEQQTEARVERTNPASLAQSLVGLFSEQVLVGVRRTVEPYSNVVPRVHLGFEDTAAVALEMRPKEDFSRSPDRCLNTAVLDYRGASRWFTIEAPVSWAELEGAGQYQVGLYGRPNRLLNCRVVLRVPNGDGTTEDFRCCDLVLTPEGRSAHGRGQLKRLDMSTLDQGRQPEMLFFFDTNSDLHLELDYMTAYFA